MADGKTNPGSFGHESGALQCTAKSKRSGKQCRGPAVLGSTTQKCRMHGGHSHTIGTANPQFKNGRSSKFLPPNLGSLYEESLSDPDLLEMSSHIALLEARMHQIIGESSSDHPVPRWQNFQEATGSLLSAMKLKEGKEKETRVKECTAALEEVVNAGVAWDSTWGQVVDLMEQIRKMTDVEVKRRKELNHMIPVERVLILVMAVSDAVKRNVSNPAEIMAVQQEVAKILGTNSTLNDGMTPLVPAGMIINTKAINGKNKRLA